MVKLWSVALLVLGAAAVQAGRHGHGGLGLGGLGAGGLGAGGLGALGAGALGVGALAGLGPHHGKAKHLGSLGLGYALGYGVAHHNDHPTGLYASPLYSYGHHYGHHYPSYASGYGYGQGQYGTKPKYGLHLGYEVGYQGKLGFVKLKRDNLRQVQVSFGLGRPNEHPVPYHG